MVAYSPLVPGASPSGLLTATSATSMEQATVSSTRQSNASSAPGFNAPDRVACLSSRLKQKGLSQRATSYVLKSWRPGTAKQYSAAWKSFCRWCGPKQVDPLCASLGVVCDFLTEQFETENKAYSTINSYRSALSSILPPFEGKLLGEHPVIVRLLKGMYVTCPPQSRYTTTWDVNILLNCLETWDPLCGLTLKQLTIKTVALVALVSAQRSQALAAFRLDFMHKVADSI